MNKKISLVGARLSDNFGGPSLLVSTKIALSRFFPSYEYTLFVPYRNYSDDKLLAPHYDIIVAPYINSKYLLLTALWKNIFGCLYGRTIFRNIIHTFSQSDAIIDTWGIFFADTLGSNSFKSRMAEGVSYILGKILGKKVVKYTADSGPFYSRWNRFFARLYFHYFIDLILARDETTKQEIINLGVRTPILVVPDTAFLLPVQETSATKQYAKLHKQGPVVGLSISYQARNRKSKNKSYLDVMAEFVAYLIERYNASVLLLPNELSKGQNDDLKVAVEIDKKVSNDRCIVIKTNTLLAQELKGIINQCDVMVACRYHSIVASLSLGIPTLAIGWHHKYEGVLKLFQQQERVCNIETLNIGDLIRQFEDLWENREEIGNTIKHYLPGVKEKIFNGAETCFNTVKGDI